jgi:hypothetical protein
LSQICSKAPISGPESAKRTQSHPLRSKPFESIFHFPSRFIFFVFRSFPLLIRQFSTFNPYHFSFLECLIDSPHANRRLQSSHRRSTSLLSHKIPAFFVVDR